MYRSRSRALAGGAGATLRILLFTGHSYLLITKRSWVTTKKAAKTARTKSTARRKAMESVVPLLVRARKAAFAAIPTQTAIRQETNSAKAASTLFSACLTNSQR